MLEISDQMDGFGFEWFVDLDILYSVYWVLVEVMLHNAKKCLLYTTLIFRFMIPTSGPLKQYSNTELSSI